MKQILFVVNKNSNLDISRYLKKYLNLFSINFSNKFPTNPEFYDLIVLWNFQKIIPHIENKKNVIIFHSSDLPSGKGWAPIYYCIVNNQKFYTISGILPGKTVDSGDIVVQAKFMIKKFHTAQFLRKCDDEISIIMIKKIFERFPDMNLVGKKQIGEETFYKRRYPSDNEIKIDLPFEKLINHFRACEPQHPAFFSYDGEIFDINIQPRTKPSFPNDLKIKFFNE